MITSINVKLSNNTEVEINKRNKASLLPNSIYARVKSKHPLPDVYLEEYELKEILSAMEKLK